MEEQRTASAAFSSVNACLDFKAEVTLSKRYLRSPTGGQFLHAVARSCKSRLRDIPQNSIFWRAHVGHEWLTDSKIGKRVRGPHRETRMKPLRDRAYEGRVNPKGIPCLYFATTREVAMSEVRPWIGSVVSAARFSTVRSLTAVDCSVFHGKNIPYVESSTPEKIVWAYIDHAFSQPVTRSDNTAHYAATQILAEVFRSEGYDGIIYRSAYSADGYNVALFDLNCADQIDSSLYEVKNAIFEFAPLTDSPE